MKVIIVLFVDVGNMDFEFSFSTGEELVREDTTIGDLINILKEFPVDLPIHGVLYCIVDEDQQIAYLEDGRLRILMQILLDCPFCSQEFQRENSPVIN